MAVADLGSPTASAGVSAAASLTFAYTVPSGAETDIVMIVNAQLRDDTVLDDRSVASITYDGTALTQAIENDAGVASTHDRPGVRLMRGRWGLRVVRGD